MALEGCSGLVASNWGRSLRQFLPIRSIGQIESLSGKGRLTTSLSQGEGHVVEWRPGLASMMDSSQGRDGSRVFSANPAGDRGVLSLEVDERRQLKQNRSRKIIILADQLQDFQENEG